MNTFTFTDNRPIHEHTLTLTAAQVAEHLAKDPQFVFYWRKGWDARQAANRSLYTYAPTPEVIVCPTITEEQWPEVDAEIAGAVGRGR